VLADLPVPPLEYWKEFIIEECVALPLTALTFDLRSGTLPRGFSETPDDLECDAPSATVWCFPLHDVKGGRKWFR
jgi:hypothetical protein